MAPRLPHPELRSTTPPAWLLAGLLPLLAAPALAQAPQRIVAQAPQRIVALAPSLTEAVCALGRCGQLVGVDRHSDWPPQAAALPRVGGLEDAQIEHIVSLQPDLVLLGPRSRAGERLRSLGVPVLGLDARSHADLRRTLEQLGEALGQRAQAQALWLQMQAQLDAAAARVPAGWRGRPVYLELAPGVTVGGQSFLGETLRRLGLANIADGETTLFPRLNPEQVLRARPELVIGPALHLADAAQRPGWVSLPAVQRGRICRLDAQRMDLLQRPGPRVGEAAQMLVDCLLDLPPP